jgi:uncharacterized protein YneF (UPF0154 family)
MEFAVLILSIVLIFLSPVIAGGFLAARPSKRDPRTHPTGPTTS